MLRRLVVIPLLLLLVVLVVIVCFLGFPSSSSSSGFGRTTERRDVVLVTQQQQQHRRRRRRHLSEPPPTATERANPSQHLMTSAGIEDKEEESETFIGVEHRRLSSPVQEQKDNRGYGGGSGGSVFHDDYPCYRSTHEVYESMDQLAIQYPHLVTIKTIGQSYWKEQNPMEGNDIKVMILGATSSAKNSSNTTTNNTNSNHMVILGGQHSRELQPPEIIMRFAEYLLEHYNAYDTTNNNTTTNNTTNNNRNAADITWILNRTTIHLIPMANPDGRQIVEEDLSSYHRDNGHGCSPPSSRPTTGNATTTTGASVCPVNKEFYYNQTEHHYHDGHGERKECGVDLNRNYPMFYGDESGRSSSDPCSECYRGNDGPLSEPESRAIFQYTSGLFADSNKKRGTTPEEAMARWEEACPLKASSGMFLDIHSKGNLILFPWLFKNTTSPNHQSLLTMAAKLAKPGNYSLWGPHQEGLKYLASGNSKDANYGINCVASFGYEVGTEFYSNCTELEIDIVPTMMKSLLYAAKSVAAPYSLALGPDILGITVNSTDSSSVSMVVEASDDKMIVEHAIFEDESNRSQPIEKIEVFVDKHPNDSSTSRDGILMDLVDGMKDVIATLTLDLSHLKAGKHIVYFQATDTDGYAGPVSAIYIDLQPTTRSAATEGETAGSSRKSERDGRISQKHSGGMKEYFPCYRSIDELYDRMDEFATQYPHLVAVKTIGKSFWKQEYRNKGNDIKVMIIGANKFANSSSNMMIVGGQHSRELPPPETILRWAEHLLDNYGNNKDADISWILNRTNIHLVPLANLDGRQIVQHNLNSFHRKNGHSLHLGLCGGHRDDHRHFHHHHEEPGVDLNRNYPFAYGNDKGSSADPCSEIYRGSGPLSEPETQAIFRYASGLFPDSIKKGTPEQAMERKQEACPTDSSGIFIDIHSQGNQVYFPWGYSDSPSPNHQSLLTMAAKLAKPGDFGLWGPHQEEFIKPVSGDTTDAMYGINCVFSQGFEIGTFKYAPCNQLVTDIVPTMKKSLIYAAKCVAAPYLLPLGPDVLSISVNSANPRNVTMVVKVSDEAMIVEHAIFEDESDRSQPIAQVKVFVDQHPYDSTTNNGTGVLMDPEDGAFNSKEEVATLTLDLSHLTGHHVLYFQATDTEGYAGPASAVYVDIKASQAETEGGEGEESKERSIDEEAVEIDSESWNDLPILGTIAHSAEGSY